MNKYIKIAIIILSLPIYSCKPVLNAQNTNISSSDLLITKLKHLNSKGILFGHQDDLAYGIGWKYDGGKTLQSDVEKATGSLPAILGWDIGHIGDSLNIDNVPFEHIKKLIIKGDSLGVINTVSWHPSFLNNTVSSWDKESNMVNKLIPGGENHQELIKKLDYFSDFLNSLKRADGSLIPIIFRPWHEMDGNWFWWGKDFCSNDEYKKLFVFTISYLKNTKGLNNLLIAYSPDRHFHSEEEYLTWYPGDEFIDILGIDNYYDFKPGGEGIDAIVKKLEIVTETASKKNKIAAFTETGSSKLENPNWYTNELFKVLNQNGLLKKISYVLVWRNHDLNHFFVPFSGHPAFSDFIKFTEEKEILLLKDIK